MKLKMLVLVGILSVGLPMVSFAQISVTPTISLEANCAFPIDTTNADWTSTIICLQNRVSKLENRINSLESRLSALESRTVPTPIVEPTCPSGCTCSENATVCPAGPVVAPSTPAPVVVTPPINVTPTEAKVIQQFLGVKADGIIGPKTRAAVNKFQSEQGITATGMVDKTTLEKMKMLAPTIAPSLNTSIQQVTP